MCRIITVLLLSLLATTCCVAQPDTLGLRKYPGIPKLYNHFEYWPYTSQYSKTQSRLSPANTRFIQDTLPKAEGKKFQLCEVSLRTFYLGGPLSDSDFVAMSYPFAPRAEDTTEKIFIVPKDSARNYFYVVLLRNHEFFGMFLYNQIHSNYEIIGPYTTTEDYPIENLKELLAFQGWDMLALFKPIVHQSPVAISRKPIGPLFKDGINLHVDTPKKIEPTAGTPVVAIKMSPRIPAPAKSISVPFFTQKDKINTVVSVDTVASASTKAKPSVVRYRRPIIPVEQKNEPTVVRYRRPIITVSQDKSENKNQVTEKPRYRRPIIKVQ